MKWIMAGAVGLAGLLAVYLLLFQLPEKAPTAENPAPVEIPNTPVDTAKAESVYKSNCMGCHGTDYQGGMGPALKTVGSVLSREEIYKKITKGGGGMPAFEGKLTEEEIVNLTNWLATFK
ncbi:c-type cytochrome [Paenibacillus sp. GCM10027627]|uniref:c-type cytochrome n=1 Tax=unclassified Paenibacillus TaxID=185978 RepID=UPI003632F5B9